MPPSTTSTPAARQPSRTTLWFGVATLLLLVISVFLGQSYWQAAVLGVVEGLTEFLPISSTAHLLLASDLIGFQNSIGGTFEIFIQLGAILAVVGYFAQDLLSQAAKVRTDRATQRFWIAIIIAFLPAAVIGLLFRKWIKAVLFDSPTTIAWALIIGGLVLIALELWHRRPPTAHQAEQTSWKQALAIGFAQVLALVPGVSRSGASMVGGMLAGLDRRAATAFSFYLAMPTLGAATIVDLLSSLDLITAADVGRLLMGTVVSFVVAWLSIDWLLRYVSRNSFTAFGIYRILAGILVLALVAVGVL